MMYLNHLSGNRDGDFEPVNPSPVWDSGSMPVLCCGIHVVAAGGLRHQGLADAATCPHSTRLPVHPSVVVGMLHD